VAEWRRPAGYDQRPCELRVRRLRTPPGSRSPAKPAPRLAGLGTEPIQDRLMPLFHNPMAVDPPNRQCAVVRVTPNVYSGSFHHEHPDWARHTIAASTCRSSTRRQPSPRRCVGAGGINGAADSHNGSGTHYAVGSSTKEDHPR
jgi:hypothetical protein